MICAGASITVGSAGCLAQQDDGVIDGLLQLNRAPWIVSDKALASGKFGDYVELQTGADCEVWFEAVAEDPDVDDELEFRWYVTRIEPRWERLRMIAGYLRNTGQARREPERIDFKKQVVNDLSQPGLYHVQFMVADGRLLGDDVPGSIPRGEPIPGTDGGINPRFAAYYSWTVRMEAGDCAAPGEFP